MSRTATAAPRTHAPMRRRRCHRSRRCTPSRRERSCSILRISAGGRCTILSACYRILARSRELAKSTPMTMAISTRSTADAAG